MQRLRKISRTQFETLEFVYEGTHSAIAREIEREQRTLVDEGWTLTEETYSGSGRKGRGVATYRRESDAIGEHIARLEQQPMRHYRRAADGTWFDPATGEAPAGRDAFLFDGETGDILGFGPS